jgi:hypothetical protein
VIEEEESSGEMILSFQMMGGIGNYSNDNVGDNMT